MNPRPVALLIFLTLALVMGQKLQAVQQRFTHYGVRPLGMGNAFTAVADDFNALYYNPAGLTRTKEWHLELINPTFEIADRTLTSIKTFSSGLSSEYDETLDQLRAEVGKTHHLGFGINPNFVTHNFGFGLNFDFNFDLEVNGTISSDVGTVFDVIAPIAYAHSFLDDRLSLGGAVKMRAQGGVDDTFNLETISNLSSTSKLDELVKSGYGVGFDLGLLFSPFKLMEPTFGLSVLDVGGTAYKAFDVGKVNLGAPSAKLPSVNTGVSIKPYQTENTYLLLALDGQSLNQPFHYSHKLVFGMEWGYGRIIKFQTGLHDGYASGGFQFDVGVLKVRFATYTVDHGPTVGIHPNLIEPRYVAQIKMLL